MSGFNKVFNKKKNISRSLRQNHVNPFDPETVGSCSTLKEVLNTAELDNNGNVVPFEDAVSPTLTTKVLFYSEEKYLWTNKFCHSNYKQIKCLAIQTA